jgi:hypothetical protein
MRASRDALKDIRNEAARDRPRRLRAPGASARAAGPLPL